MRSVFRGNIFLKKITTIDFVTHSQSSPDLLFNSKHFHLLYVVKKHKTVIDRYDAFLHGKWHFTCITLWLLLQSGHLYVINLELITLILHIVANMS